MVCNSTYQLTKEETRAGVKTYKKTQHIVGVGIGKTDALLGEATQEVLELQERRERDKQDN